MITARRNTDGSFGLVNGLARLKAQLALHSKAEVIDLETGQTVYVHEVNGALVALSEESQANVEDLANAAINRARALKKQDARS